MCNALLLCVAGMNEQELPSLESILINGTVTLVSEQSPRVATTLDRMRAVYKSLRSNTMTSRPISRLHVHTLAYQAIMTDAKSKWANTMAATAKASLTAHRHTCSTPEVQLNNAKMLMDEGFTTSAENGERKMMDEKRPISCWKETITGSNLDVDICVAPVLVCTDVKKTGGGGDNVSSAGLVLQL